MKKALGKTQTLRAGCSKTEPKIFGGPPKFNQLEMVTTFTYKPSLVKIDACNFEFIVVTDPQTNKQTNTPTNTHTQTHRQDRLQ